MEEIDLPAHDPEVPRRLRRERMHRLYLVQVRPIAAIVAIVVWGTIAAVRPSPGEWQMLIIVTGSLLFNVGMIGALRVVSSDIIVRATLVVDAAVVYAAVQMVGRPEFTGIGYFWVITIAAYFLSGLDVAALTVMSIGLTTYGLVNTGERSLEVIVGSDLMLGLVGAICTMLASTSRSIEQEVLAEREIDAQALHLSEQVRSSIDLGDVLQHIVTDLGAVSGATRCVLRTTAALGGEPELYEWHREELQAIPKQPPSVIRRVIETGECMCVNDIELERDPATVEFMRTYGIRAVYASPLRWQDQVIAVIGFQHLEPQVWEQTAAVRLVEMLEGQLAAALVQSALYRQQQVAVRRLGELDTLRDQLIASVSHELRTPLTSILGFIQTLRRPDIEFPEEQRDQYLEMVERGACRLQKLVDDLLDYSRLNRGQPRLRRARVSSVELAQAALDEISVPSARAVEIQVEKDVGIEVDPGRIFQVLTNLVMNGIRHGRGTVTIRCSGDDRNAVIGVSDEGDGIPDRHLAQLFMPFAHWGGRSDSTGLGLAIARGIAEAHGGSLDYHPGLNGRRHEFVITLPANGSHSTPDEVAGSASPVA